MNVAILSHEYPPYIFGGQGTFAHALAHGLIREGITVQVITGIPKSPNAIGAWQSEQTFEDGIKIARLPYLNVPLRFTNFQLLNMKKISQIAQDGKIDIIHGQSCCTYPAIKHLKKIAPVLVTFHTSPLMEKTAAVRAVFRGGSLRDFYTFLAGYPVWHQIYLKELVHSNRAVSVSRALQSELIKEMGVLYENKIQSIHNGVNLDFLDQEYDQVNPEICESDNVILFAGRLFWRKGALSIVKMAHLLQKQKSNLKIIVHGTGPLYDAMQKSIQTLGLTNIALRGFTTRKQLIQSLKLCKYVAIPSLYEACPMILLESMCLGKIPLMLNLPFSLELTENGKYGLFADDIEGLVDKIVASGRHEANQSSKIKAFARRTYDLRVIIHEYIKTYEELTAYS
ncbi:MAG: glycosyltransferase family 4 protein [Nitrososphaerota archaeon]|jgi:glycosyltransferase involved in cell wall biosynthesis|nr:glycosyltransferase family 4 protein [Nitrososphaerota archaeon]